METGYPLFLLKIEESPNITEEEAKLLSKKFVDEQIDEAILIGLTLSYH